MPFSLVLLPRTSKRQKLRPLPALPILCLHPAPLLLSYPLWIIHNSARPTIILVNDWYSDYYYDDDVDDKTAAAVAAVVAPPSSTVFVGNLSWGTTSEDLKAFMSSLGEVVSAEVQSHADSGRSKGWG